MQGHASWSESGWRLRMMRAAFALHRAHQQARRCPSDTVEASAGQVKATLSLFVGAGDSSSRPRGQACLPAPEARLRLDFSTPDPRGLPIATHLRQGARPVPESGAPAEETPQSIIKRNSRHVHESFFVRRLGPSAPHEKGQSRGNIPSLRVAGSLPALH